MGKAALPGWACRPGRTAGKREQFTGEMLRPCQYIRGEDDFLFFLKARTDPGQLIKNMNNEILLQSLVDARTFEDTTYAALFTAEAKKRKLKVPKPDATFPTGTTVKRKFSFDD
jgi:hypothetical protein